MISGFAITPILYHDDCLFISDASLIYLSSMSLRAVEFIVRLNPNGRPLDRP